MAWELDCVACDVVPLDANHVVVLGLVPVLQGDNEGESKSENGTSSSNKNDVELQIVSRNDGTVRYCDALPLLKSRSIAPVSRFFPIPRDSGMPANTFGP